MTSYDEVPYPIYSHSQTHPAELATLARLHGLESAPVRQCRVLEIGCAQGGNLIPMAYGLPASDFVGVDMSPRQIETGRGFVEQLGLKNIRLQALNLLDVDDSFGSFDYIIAHGFYSWVPPAVREQLMAVCQRHLSPRGVAYISYNAYPGWRSIQAIRDMLLYRVKDVDPPMQRAELAREFLRLLADYSSSTRSVSAGLLQAYADYLQTFLKTTHKGDEGYFLHDILEETNDPVYFHEFAGQAARHSLQYLADTDFRASLLNALPAEVTEIIGGLARDRVEWEQYCDFVNNRMFRQSLICRAGFEPGFKLSLEALQTFRFGSVARAEGDVDMAAVAVQKFVSHNKASISTDHPVSKAALHHLIGIWPRTLTFKELLAAARTKLGIQSQESSAAAADAQMLAKNLLSAYTHSDLLVAFTVYEPDYVDVVSDRPQASAWARLQAEFSTTITTLRHGRYLLEPYEQFLIRLLDGRHTRGSLVEELVSGPVARGDLAIEKEGRTITDAAELREQLALGVDNTLTSFAAAPLLLA
jgi:methyltransferase-like protein